MGQTDVRTPPTLVVHGDADETLPIEQARRYAESVDALAAGEFVVIEGGSHQFPHDSLDRTVEETDRFLSSCLVAGDGGPEEFSVGADRAPESLDAGDLQPGSDIDLDEPPGGDRTDW